MSIQGLSDRFLGITSGIASDRDMEFFHKHHRKMMRPLRMHVLKVKRTFFRKERPWLKNR